MPDTAANHTTELRRVATHIEAVRTALRTEQSPPNPATSAQRLGAVRLAHLDVVSTIAALNSAGGTGRQPNEETRLSMQALTRAATLLAEADRHLVALTSLTRTFTNPYGVTPRQHNAAREQVRHADKALSLAAKSLNHHAERSSRAPDHHLPTALTDAAERIQAARTGLAALRQPHTLHTAPAHIGAVRQAHLDVVSIAATLTATRSPGSAPHPAGLALRDAAMSLAASDQHLVALTKDLWRNNVTGVTYTADNAAHHQSLRRAERALDHAAEGLRQAAEPARSGLRATAARVRSAFSRRATPGSLQLLEATSGAAPAPTAPARKPR
ncbi:hypothetical protein ABZW30_08160 [Kitasatospora sp. NPDC004669]|uniref:hypothetical protein n=1 Tax=Kitasatospora sp. NPDC004669 TaxID=3154555 RepID=UPI0033AD029E